LYKGTEGIILSQLGSKADLWQKYNRLDQRGLPGAADVKSPEAEHRLNQINTGQYKISRVTQGLYFIT